MFSLGCRDDEEKLGLHCVKKCSLLAGPAFPLHKSFYTCTRRGCNKNEISSLGVCYEKCKECLFLGVLDTVITFVDQNMKMQAYSVGIRRYIRKHAESQYTGKKVSKNMSQRRTKVKNCAVDTMWMVKDVLN